MTAWLHGASSGGPGDGHHVQRQPMCKSVCSKQARQAHLTTCSAVEDVINADLKPFRVAGLRHRLRSGNTSMSVPCEPLVGACRACARISAEVARAHTLNERGWRVDPTNSGSEHRTLAQTADASHHAALGERIVARFTGRPLSVQRADHRIGVGRGVTLALRVLTVLEA